MELLAFFAGPPETGEDRLAALFEVNNLSTSRRTANTLADDFAYRRLAGETVRPLLEKYDLVVGLQSGTRPGRPFLTEFQELDHLLKSVPEAVLIFNETDEESWIRRMQSRNGGAASAFQASWLNIPEDDLPALWSAQFKEQREQLVAARANGATVLFLDTNGSFAGWSDRLSPWFDLPTIPGGQKPRKRLAKRTRNGRDASAVPPACAQVLTDKLARHCLGNPRPEADGGAVLSAIYAEWDGAQAVTKQDGSPFPVRFGDLGGRMRYLAKSGIRKACRVEGVINEALSSDAVRPLRIDMEDCRLYGVEKGDIPTQPVVTYCRRRGARNVVLWPLPEYHSIGATNFVGAGQADELRFEDKLDILFWRGSISGHCSDVTRGVFLDEVWKVCSRLLDQPESEDLWALFSTCTRVSVLTRHNASTGIDLRFVSGRGFEMFSKHPRTSRLCGQRTDRPGMLRHRYILSMRGYDTGSNFISAANSNSVVLREEDGWELFYSPLFRPWDSYIPLAPGLHDLEEKLEWARGNPARCIEISAAARSACSYLASSDWRRTLLRTIIERL